MRNQSILLSLLASLAASSGCKQLECAEGTIERDGRCEADNGSFEETLCGPFTSLMGDRCVPDFPPTVCEDGSTEPEIDVDTGVTVCKGMGGGVCGGPIGCPTPTGASKQTICGQLYNFETNEVFGDAPGTPSLRCDPANPTTTGPCALTVVAYDALRFAAQPTTEPPLAVGDVYLDNCGRFRLTNVETNGTGPFLGIGVDDAGMPFGPNGVTVTTAIATPKQGMTATKDVEHFIVELSTIGKWANGGPPFSMTAGIYAPVFRAHKAATGAARFENQAGVTITKNGNSVPSNDFYFTSTETTRETIDTDATATGMNGTVLVNNAVASEGLVWNGQGGLGEGCRWEPHAGASLPGVVFIQLFKKLDISGQTCND